VSVSSNMQVLCAGERAMAKLQRMVDQHYKDSVPAPEDMLWSENQICVAKYHVDNNWYRAKIREVRGCLSKTTGLKIIVCSQVTSQVVWMQLKIYVVCLQILDSNCDELDVQFVDYGNTETVPVQDLRKAAFVTTVPIQCFKCEFFNLFPVSILISAI
jgi:hypothetical protein